MTEEDKSSYITVTSGGNGYFAVQMWWNPKEPGCGNKEGFWEPWQTGIGRYKKQEQAIIEAKQWAEAEELRYVEP